MPTLEPEDEELAEPSPTVPGRETGESVTKCPWCGAEQELFLEPGGDVRDQSFMEECRECGRDFRVEVTWEDSGAPRIRTGREGQG